MLINPFLYVQFIISDVLQDTDLSRNIPGKVKVSAPNLLNRKKK